MVNRNWHRMGPHLSCRAFKGVIRERSRGKGILEEALLRSREELMKAIRPLRSLKG